MYEILFREYFLKKLKKIQAKQPNLKKTLATILEDLEQNPFAVGLKTHKVVSKNFGKMYSSRITGDLRLIWNFQKEKIQVIEIWDIGGHSGSNQVYK